VITNLIVGLHAAALAAQPTPGPNNPWDAPAKNPPGLDTLGALFFGWGKWILLAAGVLGLFICAGQMLIGRRNRSATAVDGATGIPWVLAGLTVAALAGGVVPLLLQ